MNDQIKDQCPLCKKKSENIIPLRCHQLIPIQHSEQIADADDDLNDAAIAIALLPSDDDGDLVLEFETEEIQQCTRCGYADSAESIVLCFRCHYPFHRGCLGVEEAPSADSRAEFWSCRDCVVPDVDHDSDSDFDPRHPNDTARRSRSRRPNRSRSRSRNRGRRVNRDIPVQQHHDEEVSESTTSSAVTENVETTQSTDSRPSRTLRHRALARNRRARSIRNGRRGGRRTSLMRLFDDNRGDDQRADYSQSRVNNVHSSGRNMEIDSNSEILTSGDSRDNASAESSTGRQGRGRRGSR